MNNFIHNKRVDLPCLHEVEIKIFLLWSENHFSWEALPVRLLGGVDTKALYTMYSLWFGSLDGDLFSGLNRKLKIHFAKDERMTLLWRMKEIIRRIRGNLKEYLSCTIIAPITNHKTLKFLNFQHLFANKIKTSLSAIWASLVRIWSAELMDQLMYFHETYLKFKDFF